jgi:predicted permease
MTRSLEAARRAYPGFDAEHVTAVSVDVRQGGYDETRGRLFYRRLLETTRATAGTETATLALYNPMAFADTPSQPVAIDGYEPRPGERLAFMSNTVASDYFRTLRIPIVAGRAFDDRDDVAGSPVAIVNATLAERFWGDAAGALGKRIRSGDGDWRTIVGVAADLKYAGVGDARRPYLYLPFLQAYRPGMILHTRGLAPVDRLVEHARAAIGALDANLPILYARPLTERISIALFFLNWGAMMLFVFGTSGIALAALGTYGLVSYVVQQSVQEIGIRMALGASGGAVVRRFLARGAWLGAIGAALGVIAALGLTRFLRSALVGVSPTDAVSFAAALGIVLGSVLAATLIPAWRAARTSPLSALRLQ